LCQIELLIKFEEQRIAEIFFPDRFIVLTTRAAEKLSAD